MGQQALSQLELSIELHLRLQTTLPIAREVEAGNVVALQIDSSSQMT